MTPEQFVSALRARGVTLSVKNNRLRLNPGSTWRKLTEDEAQCIAEHRAAIKRLVDEPIPPPVPRALAERTTERERVAVKSEPVVWTADYSRRITARDLIDAGVSGSDRAAYERAREWLREQARQRRADDATRVMFESGRRHQRGTHGGYRG